MIYKSYILEQNINSINEKIALFYGVNLGLKNDLKAKIIESHKNSEILRYSQDEILKDEALLANEKGGEAAPTGVARAVPRDPGRRGGEAFGWGAGRERVVVGGGGA